MTYFDYKLIVVWIITFFFTYNLYIQYHSNYENYCDDEGFRFESWEQKFKNHKRKSIPIDEILSESNPLKTYENAWQKKQEHSERARKFWANMLLKYVIFFVALSLATVIDLLYHFK